MFSSELETLERRKKGQNTSALDSQQKRMIENEDVFRIQTAKKSTSGIRKHLPLKIQKEPEESEETWGDRRKPIPLSLRNENNSILQLNIIPYGGYIYVNNLKVDIYNTCNIDCGLQCLYVLFKSIPMVKEYFELHQAIDNSNVNNLIRCFRHIDNGNYSAAKEIVCLELLNLSPAILRTGNLIGTESRFFQVFDELIMLKQHVDCSNSNCSLEKESYIYPVSGFDGESVEKYILKYNSKIQKKKCDGCSAKLPTIWYTWPEGGAPPFVVLSLAQSDNGEATVPRTLTLAGQSFRVFAYTIYRVGHFTTVFVINKTRYIYDGTRPGRLHPHIFYEKGHFVNSVWLVKI